MYNKQELYIDSTNGKNKLHLVIWEPAIKPIGILQISHGMIEHINRYDDFATFLNSKGYIVVGNDHLAHGKTVNTPEELGYFNAEDPSSTVVDDLHQVTLFTKEHYINLPYFLLGHSMGSFILRRYLMTYGHELDGAIIMGTGSYSSSALVFAKILTTLIGLVKSPNQESPLLEKICFHGNNKKITHPHTSKDWLTKDTQILNDYLHDPLCCFNFSLNGYQTLFDTLAFIQNPDNLSRIPKKLPIFMVAGKDDPIGNYGKAVSQIYETYKALNIQDLSMKLYEHDRHEILNELNRNVIYTDLYEWLQNHLPA